MPWFWTDDVACLLIERDLVDPAQVQLFVERPYAVAMTDGADAVEVMLAVLGRVEAGAA